MPKCPKCGTVFGEDKELPKKMAEPEAKKPLPPKKKWVPKRNELGIIVNKPKKQDDISY